MTTRQHLEDRMVTATEHRNHLTLISRAVDGALGGLAGGLVFGVLMQMMGMIGMIAMLVGSTSVAVGWVVHLAVSAFIGASFGVLLGSRATGLVPAVVLGMLYGLVWWVLGALIMMPARLGMPVFELNAMAWQSLAGHLMFGLVLGAVFFLLTRRHHR